VKNKSIQRHCPAVTPIRTCLYSHGRTHQRSLIKAFKPARFPLVGRLPDSRQGHHRRRGNAKNRCAGEDAQLDAEDAQKRRSTLRRACCLLPRRPARRARAARCATCAVWSRGRYSAVSCQRPAATLERRAAQLVTNAPASDRGPRARHRQAMCSRQPNGGRSGRLAAGELPLRKNNYRCQNKNRLSRILALKPLHHTGCGNADSACKTVPATVNLGGRSDIGFWIFD